MKNEGPPLELLTRRLAETPSEFLLEPRLGQSDGIHVEAVAGDLLRALGAGPLSAAASAALRGQSRERDRNRLRLALLGCWLLGEAWFAAQPEMAPRAEIWLTRGLADLAADLPAERCVSDGDRREELARLALAALDLRPAGETEAQARDRLNTLSSVERRRVVAAARAAEARAREVREAMARQAAYDAQMKSMRE